MAQPIDQKTDVEASIRELQKKRNIFGYTSNKYGRIVLVNKEVYENMLRNNDTLRDSNGLNDVFADITEAELKKLKECTKMRDREKAKKESEKIIVKAVARVRNFMEKLHGDIIDEEKSRLSTEVIEQLRKKPVASVDNSAEIEAKDAEIEALKSQLEWLKSSAKAGSKVDVKEKKDNNPTVTEKKDDTTPAKNWGELKKDDDNPFGDA